MLNQRFAKVLTMLPRLLDAEVFQLIFAQRSRTTVFIEVPDCDHVGVGRRFQVADETQAIFTHERGLQKRQALRVYWTKMSRC